MTPDLSEANVPYCRVADTELLSDDAVIVTARPNHPHEVRCQLGVVVRDAVGHSPFFAGVADVVGLCPEKEMGWVYAGRIIALVKHPKVARDASMSESPRKSVSQLAPSGLWMRPATRDRKATVATRYSVSAQPNPAVQWAALPVNERPESRFYGKFAPGHTAPPMTFMITGTQVSTGLS